MTTAQKSQIKVDNEALIKQLGCRINDWLPILDASALRVISEIKGRMAVMNAMINIAFGAPTHVIKKWIEANNLVSHLSGTEKKIKGNNKKKQ